MKKTLISVLVLFSLLVLLTLPASAGNVGITYNGTRVNVETELRNGTTFVPLRAFSDHLGSCTIVWNSASRQATVSGAFDLTVSPDTRSARCGGANVKLSAPGYISDGTLWVPVRAIASALGCEIGWTQKTLTVNMNTNGFIWLARIIQAEAGAEPYAGKIAVGNVVLNRVASPAFPNSVYDVVFDPSYGGQFTPAVNGTINNTPSAESTAAARACIAGENTAGNSLYFFNPRTSTRADWIEDNRDIRASIGNHVFYS